MNRRALVTSFVLTASIALLAACSDSKTVGSETTVAATTTNSVAETVPATDAATTTVADTTTTAAASTTTVAAGAELVLRDFGIGSFALGGEAGPVIDGISSELGAPIRDESADYPVADGSGEYTTADGEIGFVAPMGRTVCWSINVCAEFGGGSVASMSFTGWTYANDPTAALSSASGGTIGARWVDLGAREVDEGGCYSVGSGTIDDIRVRLESTGDPFSSFDDAGNYIATVPDAADVTIISM
ncbi:MAG: hypothetical protein LH616_00030, partial [Ilumatobacteraceae bacterium]|nr:hypothetical protein [Ilumatobacteraceae bacterium]